MRIVYLLTLPESLKNILTHIHSKETKMPPLTRVSDPCYIGETQLTCIQRQARRKQQQQLQTQQPRP